MLNNFAGAIKNLVSILSPRQKDVIEQRFGLNGEKRTLAAIGKKYNLTRERVRQLESASLKMIAKEFEKNPFINKVLSTCLGYLENKGGVIKEDYFLKEIKFLLKEDNINANQLRFIFEVFGRPKYSRDDKNFYSFWYIDKKSLNSAVDFIEKLEKFIKNKKEEIITHKKFDELFFQIVKPNNLQDFIALNYISISKKFGANSFGDFGLARWEEITPKTARAKTYLILKKHGKPLHFKEIAKRINEFKFNKRKVIHQTIHNELIKDPRFVLVGRGMYGLAESGLKPGIVKDVIARILKNKGPLYKEEIVDLVKQERFLKDNTILLNLQNKSHFKKLPNGRYHIIK